MSNFRVDPRQRRDGLAILLECSDKYKAHFCARSPVGSVRPEVVTYPVASAVLEDGVRTWIFRTADDRDRFVREVPGAEVVEEL